MALTRKGDSIVSVFTFRNNPELNILTFASMTEDWLDFAISCRRGIVHEYDIVEGPMADDQIWDYVEDLVQAR